MKLRWLFAILFLLGSANLGEAQQATKIPRIGYVSGAGDLSNQGPYVDALRQGLRDLGYVENKNFIIDFRGAAGGGTDRYPTLVSELLQLKVDVLIVPTLPAALIAKEATKTIPIVMVSNRDPVATGIVDSLARPGGNITGLATLSQDLSGKRLELLTEVIPRLMRVGIIRDPTSPATAIVFKEYEVAARALKLQIQSMEVLRENLDLEGAFQSGLKGRASAVITITTSLLFRHQKQIADLAIKNRLPSLFEGSTWVNSGGLKLTAFAAELVRLKVKVIVAGPDNWPTIAAKRATKTIPIVMVGVVDPVSNGLVASIARPGANVTGVTYEVTREQAGKNLELLKEAMPAISRVAILRNPKDATHTPYSKEAERAAKVLGVTLQFAEVQTRNEKSLEDALGAVVKARADALVLTPDPFFADRRQQIIKFAVRNKLPAIYFGQGFVNDGGLMSYGLNPQDMWRRAAIYVDKVLKGAKPADLPVEQPKKFELVINLKAAKQIGLTIPPNVLARADRVIR